MQLIREFLWHNRSLVEHDVASLSKRAARLGVVFTATISTRPTRTEDIRDKFNGLTGSVQIYGEVAFSVEVISLAGWRLVAVLTPIPSEDGTVALYPTILHGESVPADVREWTFECEHCHTVRGRKETFVLQHEDGRITQVGRTCLRDFLGHDADRILGRWAFERDFIISGDGEWLGAHRVPSAWRLSRVLTVTSAIVRRLGWVSRGHAVETGGPATAVHVTEFLEGKGPAAESLRARCQVEDADSDAAAECLAYWSASEGTSDYELNGKMLAETDTVVPRSWGLAVSLLPVWNQRKAGESERRARAEGLSNEHVGTVGERTQFRVRVVSVRHFEGDFGIKSLVVFSDTDGHVIQWWASSGAPAWIPIDKSQWITVKGTVSDHGTFREVKQTTLKRVAICPASPACGVGA